MSLDRLKPARRTSLLKLLKRTFCESCSKFVEHSLVNKGSDEPAIGSRGSESNPDPTNPVLILQQAVPSVLLALISYSTTST
jgi:hypothetical protein